MPCRFAIAAGHAAHVIAMLLSPLMLMMHLLFAISCHAADAAYATLRHCFHCLRYASADADTLSPRCFYAIADIAITPFFHATPAPCHLPTLIFVMPFFDALIHAAMLFHFAADAMTPDTRCHY
jgi:hypothetical protein